MATIVAALDAAGIAHMVTGSSASGFHGEPRTTADIDIVIDPDPSSLRTFIGALDPDRFYVGDALSALARRDSFNLIDVATGWKVDLIVRKERPFSRSEFDRRMPAVVDGVPLHMATAEDTILAKLEWARLGGSERQLRDVAGIFEVSGEWLDRAYLEYWAEHLGLIDDLARAEQLAGE
jgi:hypothetical protein